MLEPVAFPGQEFDSVEDDRVENMNGLLKGLPRPTEFNGINPSSIESSSEEAVQGLDSNLCRSCLMGQWSHDIGEDLTASVDVGDTFAALLDNGASNGFYPEETRKKPGRKPDPGKRKPRENPRECRYLKGF